MRHDELSERQIRILRAISNWIADHGEGPSIRQLGELVGLSSSGSVAYQLAQLEARGFISRSDRRWRSVRIRH
ncbi:MarR family transcriptional regulator [Streptomyces sp. NPDC002896]|uniref:LexA family protein n=1 Tax=Streptomyces sp. NPDC002896 TaxID=3154438 RepID=UPI00331E1561